MKIETTRKENELILSLEGRLDTMASPEFEKAVKENLNGVEKLVLDFTGVGYVSSAGLRVILGTQKIMNKQGKMILRNVTETVRDIFEITGFIDFLTIE